MTDSIDGEDLTCECCSGDGCPCCDPDSEPGPYAFLMVAVAADGHVVLSSPAGVGCTCGGTHAGPTGVHSCRHLQSLDAGEPHSWDAQAPHPRVSTTARLLLAVFAVSRRLAAGFTDDDHTVGHLAGKLHVTVAEVHAAAVPLVRTGWLDRTVTGDAIAYIPGPAVTAMSPLLGQSDT